MKTNISIVPKLLGKNFGMSVKTLFKFIKLFLTRASKRRTYGYNHMKNLCLVYMKLTPLCNLKCVMCGQRGDKGVLKGKKGIEEAKKLVDLETYKKMADELSERKPIYYIWGGEPLLYPDVFPLIRYIKSKGSIVSVNTNGTLLEKNAEQIVKDQWNALFVSLDAFRDVNDEIRGKGSYDKVIAGFKAINEYKKKYKTNLPFLGVVTTVTNKNYKTLSELAEASKDFNLDWHIYNLGTYTNDEIVQANAEYYKKHLNTTPYMLEGYNTGYNEGIDGEELHAILEKIHSTNYGHPSITVPALNPEKTHEYYSELKTQVRNRCIVPWTQANICFNGDVTFCADYNEYVLGNIKEQSFKEIYNGEKANKFRQEILKCEGQIFPGCVRCYQNMLFGEKVKGY